MTSSLRILGAALRTKLAMTMSGFNQLSFESKSPWFHVIYISAQQAAVFVKSPSVVVYSISRVVKLQSTLNTSPVLLWAGYPPLHLAISMSIPLSDSPQTNWSQDSALHPSYAAWSCIWPPTEIMSLSLLIRWQVVNGSRFHDFLAGLMMLQLQSLKQKLLTGGS